MRSRDTLSRIFTILTFVTSCLRNCTPVSFWKGIYSKRKDIALLGSKFSPFRVDSFSEGRKKIELYPWKCISFLQPLQYDKPKQITANSVDSGNIQSIWWSTGRQYTANKRHKHQLLWRYSEPSLQRQHLFPKMLPLKWIRCCKGSLINRMICKKSFVLFLFPHRTYVLDIC